MTSPLCRAPSICMEKEVYLIQDLLCTLDLGLTLAQAAGAMTTIKMIANQVQPLCAGIHTPRTTMMNTTIIQTKKILYRHLLCSKGKEKAHPEIGNHASREIKCPFIHLCSR